MSTTLPGIDGEGCAWNSSTAGSPHSSGSPSPVSGSGSPSASDRTAASAVHGVHRPPEPGLQNDVSVLVQDPTGTKFAGNENVRDRITPTDTNNNVEVVRFAEPAAGTWTIQVFARNLLRGPQDFALVVTGALTTALRRVPG